MVRTVADAAVSLAEILDRSRLGIAMAATTATTPMSNPPLLLLTRIESVCPSAQARLGALFPGARFNLASSGDICPNIVEASGPMFWYNSAETPPGWSCGIDV